ncbi:MAG: HDOD domain-containing protein [Candidatus Gastranaerophilales bacterium]|nr:HDOD domain-containing protein [Candidatus Gastranaerophilales bacterium]
MSNTRKNQENNNPSMYTRSINLLEDDPLEEIFALNLGDFLTEHLINPEFVDKISTKAKNKDKNKKENLKAQLKELISIYSIDNTLSLLGFKNDEDFVIYNSIAKTVKLMLNLVECNIFLAKKGEELRQAGSSDEELVEFNITEYIKEVMEFEQEREIINNEYQIVLFPMKNNFECIGVIEVIRRVERPLEFEYADLIQNMAGLFVTSLGLQKLIDEVKRLIAMEDVAMVELQNLRAQLTAIIGDLGDQQQSFVEKLAYATDLKGQYKRSHSNECAELSREICHTLGLNEKTTDLIYYAGLLQNIGKITLSEELFTKKENLTEAEWNELNKTPNLGVELLMNINFMSEVIPYINYQQERYNGGGYPEGLSGNSIPLGSRIIALAGAYCALTQDRAHRKALPNKEALEIIKQESGIKWDPAIVDVLVSLKEEK